MRVRLSLAAAAVVALLAAAPASRASDVILLRGIGTTTARFADKAPTMTLQGSFADDATVDNAHWYRGFYRPFFGYYRPFAYRPYFGYYRPFAYRPYLYGFNRPYYRPYFGAFRPYGLGYGYYGGSGFAISYSRIGASTTVEAAVPVTTLALPAASAIELPQGETLPAPIPNGGFRYDGGPNQRVPMPGAVPAPPVHELPQAVPPATTRLASQTKKLTYPAYGEPPVKPTDNRPKSLLVKSSGR